MIHFLHSVFHKSSMQNIWYFIVSNWFVCLYLSVFAGLGEKCVDSLVFETLIPKPMLQHYISLLLKHRRLIFSGPSGTGKTYLTSRLADYLLERSGQELAADAVVTFSMHHRTCKVRAPQEYKALKKTTKKKPSSTRNAMTLHRHAC